MISIVIPCYNTGHFLSDALESVRFYLSEEYEVILVNDGSTDPVTIAILNAIVDPKIKKIDQSNKGLATARNVGVAQSSGEIIFFLDSDNTVLPGYASHALSVFNTYPDVTVVYGNPVFFGDIGPVPRFSTKEYDFDQLLRGNFIDACAFVRKKDFLEVGGFSVHPDLQGWDDWELWIKLSLAGKKFHYLNFDCFGYRVRQDSMIGSSDKSKKEFMLNYIGNKYGVLFHSKFRRYFRIYETMQSKPFKYFFRMILYKYVFRKPFLN